jgi:hypothetical protein
MKNHETVETLSAILAAEQTMVGHVETAEFEQKG